MNKREEEEMEEYWLTDTQMISLELMEEKINAMYW
jgi:hypothetical protein